MKGERSAGQLAIIGILLLFFYFTYLIIIRQSINFTITSGLIYLVGVLVIKMRYAPKSVIYYFSKEKVVKG